MLNLKNKTIIVTGGASGIGKASVLACLEYGAKVLAIDINKEKLNELKDKNLKTFLVDISNYKEIENFFIKIKEQGIEPDCLVNNAGIYFGKSIFKYKNEEIDKVFNVNIKSALYFSKLFAEIKMTNKKSGVILNISSVSGEEGSGDAVYGLSKSALIGLTKSNAINFSPNIRVNALAPGIVNTPMMKNIPSNRMKIHRKSELLKNNIEPRDVANTVVFLLSDMSKNYTGAIFDINNGSYLR